MSVLALLQLLLQSEAKRVGIEMPPNGLAAVAVLRHPLPPRLHLLLTAWIWTMPHI